jgi:hypothetical protein
MSSSAKRFLRHYVEMVAAMFLGMGVLGTAMAAMGTSWHALTEVHPPPRQARGRGAVTA